MENLIIELEKPLYTFLIIGASLVIMFFIGKAIVKNK